MPAPRCSPSPCCSSPSPRCWSSTCCRPGAASAMAADRSLGESRTARTLLVLTALALLSLLLVLPLVLVFTEALAKGADAYVTALGLPDTQAAIRLTLLVAAIAVPANTAFGIAAAWCIAKFDFPGKSLLTTIVDLPFSVSPV